MKALLLQIANNAEAKHLKPQLKITSQLEWETIFGDSPQFNLQCMRQEVF